MTFQPNWRNGLMATTMLAAAMMPAQAQEADDSLVLEEIVVTAQKRAERLQDVPLAVSALSADALANSQVSSTAGVAALVPSLTYTQSTSDLNNNVRIRGVGTALFNAGLESAVSFVVDGVVMSRQGQGFQDLIDVERVEVLRGPQGTLFGKNATAGVINIVTKRPSRDFEGVAEIGIAEQGEYRARASVSGPISETVGARLTGYYTDNRGYVYDYGRGEHVYGGRDVGLRGKVEWQATENLNFLFTADIRDSESDCCQPIPYLTTNSVLAAIRGPVVASSENRTVNSGDTRTFANSDQAGGSVEASLDLGDHVLTSVTAVRNWKIENNVDVDGFNSATPLYLPFGNGYFGVNGGTADISQFTQELRLASAANQPLTYTFGLFYFNLDLDRAFTRRVGGCVTPGTAFGQPCATSFFSSSNHEANTKTDNYAAFGQVEYELTDALSAFAGFRLQREKVSYSGTRFGSAPYTGDRLLFAASTGSGSVSDTDLSGKAGLKYEIDRDAQTYFTWSRGYKGQGYDVELTANFASQSPVRPETVNSYELGWKQQALNGRLILNSALFYAKYQDLQVQSTIAPNVSVPTNAGSSVSKGAEIEFQARATSALSINGGVTLLDAKFDADRIACALPAQASAVTLATGAAEPVNSCFRLGNGTVQNVRGGDLPNAPRWRGNINVRYEDEIATDWNGFAQVGFNTQSGTTFSLEQDAGLTQGGYSTIDLSVGVLSQDDRYQLTLYVRNLTDKHFATGMQRDNILTNAANPGNILYFTSKEAARYMGGTLRVKF
ncbi:TonB-dependent receptor [Niveispirillum cyanobacteriorum]|uniref:TonB-dependent receptor n=1 Tax=Niveispirillum cyanobacteriorum TaxID=1612173 RepID=A0A2K9NHL9_9PROT|nr:TonB-dependent receptor [Niveispirillum cyanobacteriorum]AUN32573.1 TonB-dependent receptor [Niveispirillum cyanobacteriorum]GGE77143.1 TonB-dependent receptor [Niveispirillum cyanobacteriorum]